MSRGGGGHAPDIIKLAAKPNVLPASALDPPHATGVLARLAADIDQIAAYAARQAARVPCDGIHALPATARRCSTSAPSSTRPGRPGYSPAS